MRMVIMLLRILFQLIATMSLRLNYFRKVIRILVQTGRWTLRQIKCSHELVDVRDQTSDSHYMLSMEEVNEMIDFLYA